jgi:hypothetical protein
MALAGAPAPQRFLIATARPVRRRTRGQDMSTPIMRIGLVLYMQTLVLIVQNSYPDAGRPATETND